MFLVEGLGGAEHLLGTQPVALGGRDLEHGEGKRQRWRLVAFAKAGVGDLAVLPGDLRFYVLSGSAPEQAAFLVDMGGMRLTGLPAGPEEGIRRVRWGQGGIQLEPGRGLEVLDRPVTCDHQSENGGLDPAHGEDPFLALLLVMEGVGAAQVDAVEPVRALARFR